MDGTHQAALHEEGLAIQGGLGLFEDLLLLFFAGQAVERRLRWGLGSLLRRLKMTAPGEEISQSSSMVSKMKERSRLLWSHKKDEKESKKKSVIFRDGAKRPLHGLNELKSGLHPRAQLRRNTTYVFFFSHCGPLGKEAHTITTPSRIQSVEIHRRLKEGATRGQRGQRPRIGILRPGTNTGRPREKHQEKPSRQINMSGYYSV